MNTPQAPIEVIEQQTQAHSTLDRFLSLSSDLFCIKGQDGHFKQLNSAWSNVLGFPVSELLHTPWIELVHPDDVAVSQSAEAQCASQGFVEYENRCRHHEGSYRWLAWRVSQASDGLYYAVAKDITATKQTLEALHELHSSERRFRAVFNQMFQFASLLRLDGTVLEDSQTAMDFCQLQREDVVGRKFWELRCWTISEDTQEHLKNAIASAAAGNIVRYEVDILAPDDSVMTINLCLKPLFNETGQVEWLMAEGQALSERQKTSPDQK